MPKTKLDKYRYSKAEEDKQLIKKYMTKRRIYKDVDLAKKIGSSQSYVSKGFKFGFSYKMKMRIHKALQFEEGDLIALLGEKA